MTGDPCVKSAAPPPEPLENIIGQTFDILREANIVTEQIIGKIIGVEGGDPKEGNSKQGLATLADRTRQEGHTLMDQVQYLKALLY